MAAGIDAEKSGGVPRGMLKSSLRLWPPSEDSLLLPNGVSACPPDPVRTTGVGTELFLGRLLVLLSRIPWPKGGEEDTKEVILLKAPGELILLSSCFTN